MTQRFVHPEPPVTIGIARKRSVRAGPIGEPARQLLDLELAWIGVLRKRPHRLGAANQPVSEPAKIAWNEDRHPVGDDVLPVPLLELLTERLEPICRTGIVAERAAPPCFVPSVNSPERAHRENRWVNTACSSTANLLEVR